MQAIGSSTVAVDGMRKDASSLAENLQFLEGDDQIFAFSNINKLFATREILSGENPYPLAVCKTDLEIPFECGSRKYTLDSFAKESRVAALVVVQNGTILREYYNFGHSRTGKWTSFSVGKSIVSTLVGAAIYDGHIKAVTDPVTKYLPILKRTAFDDATIRDLLRMSGGESWNENYLDPDADINKVLSVMAKRNQRGALMTHLASLPRSVPTGMFNLYRTGESYLLGEIVAAAVGSPLSPYLSERIWKPFGMEADAYWLLTAEDSIEFGGGSISATICDYARFGQFMLNGGIAGGRQVLPEDWIAEATVPSAPAKQTGEASSYGYQWWIDEPDTYSARGVFGQLIHIDPKRQLVIAMHCAWEKPVTDANKALSGAFVRAVSAALS